jgi:hypothetical protein
MSRATIAIIENNYDLFIHSKYHANTIRVVLGYPHPREVYTIKHTNTANMARLAPAAIMTVSIILILPYCLAQ